MLKNVVYCLVLVLNVLPQEVNPQDIPPYIEVRYHVSIQRPQMKNGILTHYHVCSGALVSAIWAVTTGTCMDDNGNYKKLRVHLGSLNMKGGQRLKIMQVVRHPNYSPVRFMFNVAALQLEKTLTLGSTISSMNFLNLPTNGSPQGLECSITGWKVNKFGNFSNDLIRTTVRILNGNQVKGKCKPFYTLGQLVDYNVNQVYCSLYNNNIKFASEEGNPLLCNYNLWGLLTEGGDENGQGFMIFSKTLSVKDWLSNLI